MEQNFIGEGRLTWAKPERITDRYGSIYLIPEGHDSLTPEPSPSLVLNKQVEPFLGEWGSLVAVVTQARQSTHIGDLFRGIFPTIPEVGEIIELGSGWLFAEQLDWVPGICVGLEPNDGRDTDWLNPHKLYHAHEQSVKLYFHPKQQGSS